MDPKSVVVKSKSSNSAISKKSTEGSGRQYNKKTRSNANFPCHGLKKRGVYVEKRSTKTNLEVNGKEVDGISQKPPPRPRPGQKRFLASVLTILSKSTTGTQYPDIEDAVIEKQEDKTQRKGKDRKSHLRETSASDEDRVETKKRKEKFKSRVLNKKLVKDDKKRMVVLQSQREIVQTPSNYSEWSYKDASQNSNVSSLMAYEDLNNINLNIAHELRNAVLEGRNVTVKKLRYEEDEPKTLVSDGLKSQKNLYNFFVDLLETTISVYNVKAEYDDTAAADTSKTNLQINASVASRLNVRKAKKAVEFEDGIISPENMHDANENEMERQLVYEPKSITLEPFERVAPIKTKIRKPKEPFLYSNKTVPPKSKSLEINRKTIFKNKNDLINVLKQELEVDTRMYEEPKSIYQALRVMARNKKKISFDPWLDHRHLNDECILKQRKVISSRKLKKTNKDTPNNNAKRQIKRTHRDYVQSTRKLYTEANKNSNKLENTESYRTLEVYGFDYEPKVPNYNLNTSKDVSFPVHSSSSSSDFDFDPTDAILTPASTYSSLRKFSAVVN